MDKYSRVSGANLTILKEHFATDQYPKKQRIEFIARELNMNKQKVAIWFSNVRRKWRRLSKVTHHYNTSSDQQRPMENINTFPQSAQSSSQMSINHSLLIQSAHFHHQNVTNDSTANTPISLVGEMQMQPTPYKPIFKPYLL